MALSRNFEGLEQISIMPDHLALPFPLFFVITGPMCASRPRLVIHLSLENPLFSGPPDQARG